MNRNALSVQCYAFNDKGVPREVNDASHGVASAVVSYGDKMIQVSLDTERETWEIEVVGKAVVYT